jgi:hypothetical protein
LSVLLVYINYILVNRLEGKFKVESWVEAKGSPYCIWVIDTLPAESVINLPTAARKKLLTIEAFEGQVRLWISSTRSLVLPILMGGTQKHELEDLPSVYK